MNTTIPKTPTKRKRSPSGSQPQTPNPQPSSSQDIYHSTTITQLQSTFTAVYSPTLPAKILQALPDFKSATHRIAAWRTPSKQKTLDGRSTLVVGHDDDGESWAGKKVERVLEMLDVTGAIVVARWYGGVMMGPARFACIESVAREAVGVWRDKQFVPVPLKRQKGDLDSAAEQKERNNLAATLRERDSNIAVLRGLLAEKKALLSGEGEVAPVTPAKTPTYEGMGVEGLRRLEKARDRTIGFVLREIEKVEGELARCGTGQETKTKEP